jgi:carboxymethylenebutenolidase
MELKSAAGKTVPGYLADPTQVRGVVVLVHEWWGLNDQTRGVADRYASEGFATFAVDLYDGVVVKIGDKEQAGALMAGLDWGRSLGILKDAAEALSAKYPCQGVGITGFCMGGAISLFAAAKLPGAFAAVAPFYGIPDGSKVDLGAIKAPVLGHFANTDGWCTPELVNGLESKLNSVGTQATFHRYDAQHAFANEQRADVYSKTDAEAAFARTFEFFRGALK